MKVKMSSGSKLQVPEESPLLKGALHQIIKLQAKIHEL